LKAGVQIVSAPQLFPTPPDLAARMVDLAFEHGWTTQVCAEMNSECRVLEPSAGTGNLLRAIADSCEFESNLANVVAVEINLNLAHNLGAGFPKSDIRRGDFLTFNGELGKFDRIVMNPPFANGADVQHIKHAITFLNPGGKLVAICANGPRQQEHLQPLADTWEELPADTFKEQGTGVQTVLLTIKN
jgi:tRNA A58 N-methylase Trm61